MPPRAGVAEDHGPAGGPADVRVRRVLEHLFDLFLGDAVLRTVLHITIGVVIEVPEDRIEWHCPALLACGIIMPRSCTVCQQEYSPRWRKSLCRGSGSRDCRRTSRNSGPGGHI